jgi:hypothetical protein
MFRSCFVVGVFQDRLLEDEDRLGCCATRSVHDEARRPEAAVASEWLAALDR